MEDILLLIKKNNEFKQEVVYSLLSHNTEKFIEQYDISYQKSLQDYIKEQPQKTDKEHQQNAKSRTLETFVSIVYNLISHKSFKAEDISIYHSILNTKLSDKLLPIALWTAFKDEETHSLFKIHCPHIDRKTYLAFTQLFDRFNDIKSSYHQVPLAINDKENFFKQRLEDFLSINQDYLFYHKVNNSVTDKHILTHKNKI